MGRKKKRGQRKTRRTVRGRKRREEKSKEGRGRDLGEEGEEVKGKRTRK